MKRLLFSLLLVLFAATFATAGEPGTTLGFGYGGITTPTSDAPNTLANGWSAGAYFPIEGYFALMLEASQAEGTRLYNLGVEPGTRHWGFGFGLSYMDNTDDASAGLFVGPSLKLFQEHRIGLRFDVHYVALQDKIGDRNDYVDGKAMLTATF